MTDATAPTRPAAGSGPIRRNPLSAAFRVLAVDRSAMFGCLIILGFCLVALLAPLIAPFDPTEQHILDALQPPSATYWLGTDEYGRDLFSRAIHGTRPALVVGVLSVLVSMSVGVPIGIVAGYRMGWFDREIGRAHV